jgi:hypothetical protein
MRFDQFRLPARWILRSQEEYVATYTDDAGDRLTLNYFDMEPDLGADVADADGLRRFYREVTQAHGVALVEAEPVQLAGLPAVRTIMKARLQPRGFRFIGCYTLPFADSSYVVKVACEESGVTGVRETGVVHRLGSQLEIDAAGGMAGWERDPYDASHRAPFMSNLADDAKYDDDFPEHPLSRTRRHLQELADEIGVPSDLRSAPRFTYEG